MTDRLQNFVDAGWLQQNPASDEEVVDVWRNAIETLHDAAHAQLSPKNRILLGYDAGRLAAHAIVRSRDLRVRAGNHHEITIKTAAVLSDRELADELHALDDLRSRRHTLEYGWGAAPSDASAAAVLQTVRRILALGATLLRSLRPSIASQIAAPE
jgi:hypothetical protein